VRDKIELPKTAPIFPHDLNHTGLSSFNTSGNAGGLKWKFTTGGYVSSSPAIGADGAIYVGSSDDYVYAINPYGSLKWKFATGGPVGSPAIGVDGVIYVGSDDSHLYAINPDGTRKWTFAARGGGVGEPVIGADGVIFVSTRRNFYAVNSNGTGLFGGGVVSVTNGSAVFYIDESPTNLHPSVVVAEQ